MGGYVTIDDTDGICKKWDAARRCVSLENRECYNRALTHDYYEVQLLDGGDFEGKTTFEEDECLRLVLTWTSIYFNYRPLIQSLFKFIMFNRHTLY